MIELSKLREQPMSVIMLGTHPGIIQSILDYDYLLGKEAPSITAIVAHGRKHERYFWGEDEVIIPVFASLEKIKQRERDQCTAVINVQSARRVLGSSKEAISQLPSLAMLVIFAEQTPEVHALELREFAQRHDILVIGPSSVGMLIPGHAKLGAIGGTQYEQIVKANIIESGRTAIISTSGGMVNELIHTVTGVGQGVSFAIALGGDRFPVTDSITAVMAAQNDKSTEQIVFFGELGGVDEYKIAKLIDDGIVTKRMIVYIAGVVAELFENPPQFGHAKAMAESADESASAKKDRLRASGAIVCDHIDDIADEVFKISNPPLKTADQPMRLERRRRAMTSHISGDKNDEMQLLGHELLETIENNTLASLVLSLLLGKQVKSQKAIEFTDYVLRLLVDHGPYVSGAVNTIVTARAGRDLVSGLTAGLLTIGPRFGGAINTASQGWITGVNSGQSPKEFVDSYISKGGIISGIGHKKYRIDMPDPRVKALMYFSGNSNGDRYLNFARAVEELTTQKKGNLILNIDGIIGALMLDILESELGYDTDELVDLVDIEFFNALFVLSRSIGFTAHYLDQRRHDEGLFRMSPDDVRYLG